MLMERLQQPKQRTGAVVDRDHERGLVAPGNLGMFASDHQKTCRVVRLILDILGKDIETIQPRRLMAGYGTNSRGCGSLTCPLGIAGNRSPEHARKMPIQPFPALCQRLAMPQHFGNRFKSTDTTQQTMMNRQDDLSTNLQAGACEHVEGVGYHSFGGVLHRDHTAVGPTRFDLAKHLVHRAQRRCHDALTKVLEDRSLGIRSLWSQIADPE